MTASSEHAAQPTGGDYVSDRAFADFPLSAELLRGIHDLGFLTATPVQAASLEPALAGKDMIVRAKTGTGKTAAFSIPTIERIAEDARGPRAIILAPTRELAQQIAETCEGLTAHRDIQPVLLVGGLSIGPQADALKAGAQLVIGTPGRVLDHMRRGNLDMSAIQTACLDEADEMLSMGFFEDVTSILAACPSDRQVLLFSATISPDTQRLINAFTNEPEEIILSTDTDKVEGIEHVLYETSPQFHKARALLYLLDIEDPASAIIFCNTREDAATVASYLDRQGLDVQLLSGELPQGQRNRVMAQVKAGNVRFLAATDVAARGIDISDLSHVINYSLPQDAAVYLHRTGRTGRIGKKGVAINLVSGADMGTRRTLETQYQIPFVEKQLPDAETCVRMRVERQAESIRDAMGTMVFEAYLPTVRALRERPDGDMLLAAALRAFFQWDRRRRAEASGLLEDASEFRSTSSEERDRKPKKDRPPRERSKKKGDGKKRDAKKRDRRDRDAAPSDDLEALLVVDDTPAEKPKKSRGRKDRGSKPSGRAEAPLDDLDALLSLE